MAVVGKARNVIPNATNAAVRIKEQIRVTIPGGVPPPVARVVTMVRGTLDRELRKTRGWG